MALDFCILDEAGNPSDVVSMGYELHEDLMKLVLKMKNAKLLKKLENYYKDNIIPIEELDQFLMEIKEVINIVSSDKDDDLMNNLLEIIHLINKAQSRKKEIEIIAD